MAPGVDGTGAALDATPCPSSSPCRRLIRFSTLGTSARRRDAALNSRTLSPPSSYSSSSSPVPSFLHSFIPYLPRWSLDRVPFLTDFGLSNRAEGLRFKVKGHPRSPFLRQQQKPYWTIFISRKKKQSFLSLTHTHRPSSSAKRNAIETSIRARVNQRRPVMNALASLGLSSHPPLTTARPNPCTS